MAKEKPDITKVIYPKYMAFISIYSILFLTIGVFCARILDLIFPKFDIYKPKSKIIIYIEVLLQIASIAIITYIFREFTDFFVKLVPFLDKHNYGSPGKFAALIIAPTMFSVQTHLIDKLKYLSYFETTPKLHGHRHYS